MAQSCEMADGETRRPVAGYSRYRAIRCLAGTYKLNTKNKVRKKVIGKTM